MDAPDPDLLPGLEEGWADLATGVRLHWVAKGSGPLVVLLHGFPEHWYGWRHAIEPLVEAGYRVLAPDLRGYNLSSKPAEVDAYHPEVLGDDVAALLDALGASEATVVGHDWGGAAAWFFAMRHPEKLTKLVVMNMPHPVVFAEAWKTLRQKLRSAYFYFFRLRSFAAFFYRRFRAFPQRFMLWFFARRKLAWRDLDPYARAALREGAMKAMMSYYTALLSRPPDETIALARKLEGKPVHVIWGTEDPAFAERLADPGEHVTPAATVHRVVGAGHFLHLERPDEVNAALLAALAG
ncbi:MAG: epoxide hydrolase [Myxococcales bacterium]|nr:epoxide hydrolase [Myxococcales bacterium]